MYECRFSEKSKELSKEITSYFKFGFVRNPWSRMYSLYRYLDESRPRKEIDTIRSFKNFLVLSEAGEKWINKLHSMRSQLDFFVDEHNTINVDFLGHYEFLQEDFNCVSKFLLLPEYLTLPRRNSSSSSTASYIDFYDDEMISIVQRRFAYEIDLFGYKFNSPFPTNRFSRAVVPWSSDMTFTFAFDLYCICPSLNVRDLPTHTCRKNSSLSYPQDRNVGTEAIIKRENICLLEEGKLVLSSPIIAGKEPPKLKSNPIISDLKISTSSSPIIFSGCGERKRRVSRGRLCVLKSSTNFLICLLLNFLMWKNRRNPMSLL